MRRWRQLDEQLESLFDLPEVERRARLQALAAADPELCRELEELLAADREAGTFLEDGQIAGGEVALPFDGRIGPYRLLSLLGRGGMSSVYLARRDEDFEQLVAVKVSHSALHNHTFVERFHRERQLLATLEHPGIARLLDGGTCRGVPYLVLEYVPGNTLNEWCAARNATLRVRLGLFAQVLAAVAHAHRNLIVHRDLKPSNLLVTREGQVKLLDFGIAKLLSLDASQGQTTAATERLATPRYASPEQLLGEPISTACDVYSLGVVLWELLVGEPLHPLEEPVEAILRRLADEQEPPPPSSALVARDGVAARRLRGDLDAIVARCLRRDPRQRYPSVDALAEDLRRWADGRPVEARRGNRLYRLGKLLVRHRLGIAAAALVATTLLTFGFTSTLQARQLSRERDESALARERAEHELQRAETVRRFLQGLFEQSSPDNALGEELSAREILDRGARRLEWELRDEPDLRADLLRTVGSVYRQLGHYEEAASRFAAALALEKRRDPIDPSRIAATLLERGLLENDQSESREAERTLRLALAWELRSGRAQPSPSEATVLRQLGGVLGDLTDFAAGERHLLRALAIESALLGPDPLESGSTHASLAEVLRLAGHNERAGAHFERALAIQRRHRAEDHPEILSIRNNLALLLARRGDRRAAIQILEEVVAGARRSLGETHPQTATYVGNLAGVLIASGAIAEAEPIARHALALQLAVRGKRQQLCTRLLDLGHVLRLKHDRGGADAHYRQALDACTATAGPQHPNTAHPWLWLGRNDLERGRIEAAEREFEQARAIFGKSFPPSHPFVARAEGGLGACLVARGQVAAGRQKLLAAYAVVRAAEGEDAGFTRWLRAHLEAADRRRD